MLSVLAIIPGLFVAFTIGSYIVCFALAAVLQHVNPWLPFISDLGVEYPEGNIFSLLLCFASTFGYMTIYIRYRIVLLNIEDTNSTIATVSFLAMISGILSMFGLDIVGHFQLYILDDMHKFGAGLCFIMGCVYFILDSITTVRIRKCHGSLMCTVRISLSMISILSMIIYLPVNHLAGEAWESDRHVQEMKKLNAEPWHSDRAKMQWGPNISGYSLHVCATFCEWIAALAFLAYMMTYVVEFSSYTVDAQFSLNSKDTANKRDHPNTSQSNNQGQTSGSHPVQTDRPQCEHGEGGAAQGQTEGQGRERCQDHGNPFTNCIQLESRLSNHTSVGLDSRRDNEICSSRIERQPGDLIPSNIDPQNIGSSHPDPGFAEKVPQTSNANRIEDSRTHFKLANKNHPIVDCIA